MTIWHFVWQSCVLALLMVLAWQHAHPVDLAVLWKTDPPPPERRTFLLPSGASMEQFRWRDQVICVRDNAITIGSCVWR